MFTIARTWFQVKRDTRGVTALEYGLIAAVMGGLIVIAFSSLGGTMSGAFSTIGGVLTSKATAM